MRFVDINTKKDLAWGDAFRRIRRHALVIGWHHDEVDAMAVRLDLAAYQEDETRAYELAEELDVMGAGIEILPEAEPIQ